MNASRDEKPTLVECACGICLSEEPRHERTIRGYALARCSKCGFVHMNPQSPADSIDAFYEDRDESALVDLYERITTPGELQGFRDELSHLERFESPGRLLDFGCGAGYCYEIAGERGWEAHGLELGSWAKAAAARRGLANMHTGLLADQGFAKGHFDAVVSNDVFEHLQSPREILDQLRVVLKPGGHFAIQVPNYASLSIRLNRDSFTLNDPPQHVNYFTPASLRSLLSRCGFRVVHLETCGGFNLAEIRGRTVSTAERFGELSTEDREAKHLLPGDAPPPRRGVLRQWLAAPLYRWAKLGTGIRAIARNDNA